jgi:hypothetical protein
MIIELICLFSGYWHWFEYNTIARGALGNYAFMDTNKRHTPKAFWHSRKCISENSLLSTTTLYSIVQTWASASTTGRDKAHLAYYLKRLGSHKGCIRLAISLSDRRGQYNTRFWQILLLNAGDIACWMILSICILPKSFAWIHLADTRLRAAGLVRRVRNISRYNWTWILLLAMGCK